MSAGKSVRVNGDRLTTLRTEKGWSREKLAEEADMSSKSIQRAENDERLWPENINQIANALGCTQADLIADSDDAEQVQQEIPAHHELLRLKRPDSAKGLFKAVKADILEFEFDVDFDEALSVAIADLIRPIEDLRVSKKGGALKTSDEVLAIGKLSTSLRALEKDGVCTFIGVTTYRSTETEEFPTESDYEIYRSHILERPKAIILFGNCHTKTRPEFVDVGLTFKEAKDWLLDQLESTRTARNCYVDGKDFGISEETWWGKDKLSDGRIDDEDIPF